MPWFHDLIAETGDLQRVERLEGGGTMVFDAHTLACTLGDADAARRFEEGWWSPEDVAPLASFCDEALTACDEQGGERLASSDWFECVQGTLRTRVTARPWTVARQGVLALRDFLRRASERQLHVARIKQHVTLDLAWLRRTIAYYEALRLAHAPDAEGLEALRVLLAAQSASRVERCIDEIETELIATGPRGAGCYYDKPYVAGNLVYARLTSELARIARPVIAIDAIEEDFVSRDEGSWTHFRLDGVPHRLWGDCHSKWPDMHPFIDALNALVTATGHAFVAIGTTGYTVAFLSSEDRLRLVYERGLQGW